VVDGEELRARGVTDLAGALSLMAGVTAFRGGDAGPGATVPGLLGQREADDFLLVIDGVPIGGTTTPSFESIDLTDVERIEVQRGPAPVFYGTTSFAGTIQIIHYAAGKSSNKLEAWGGSFGSYGADVASALPRMGGIDQSVALTLSRQEFSDSHAQAERAQLFYRASAGLAGGKLDFDVNLLGLRQKPFSPVPQSDEGNGLADDLPLDFNANPSDGRLNQYRSQINLRYTHAIGSAHWDTLLAVTHQVSPIVQGFLTDDYAEGIGCDPAVDDCDADASGYTQLRRTTEVFLDSHIAQKLTPDLLLTYGINELYGYGHADGSTFEYFIPLNGGAAPNSGSGTIDDTATLEDRRSFFGAYVQGQWKFAPDFTLLAGLRGNLTNEERHTADQDDSHSQIQHNQRMSGSLGLNWRAIDGEGFSAFPYLTLASSFQPAQFNFSPDPDNSVLLRPETARSLQLGIKGDALSGRIDWELAGTLARFNDRVIAQIQNGEPTLINGGSDRFLGVEAELRYIITRLFQLQANYSYNDARYRNYITASEDGSANVQLSGQRLPLTALNLAGAGFMLGDPKEMNVSVSANYVGSRYLDDDDSNRTPSYISVDAKLGYRFHASHGCCGISLAGTNLSDRRDPVIASELGDSQLYRLVGRQLRLTVDMGL
jgi:iron complex outermembrane receptor protein